LAARLIAPHHPTLSSGSGIGSIFPNKNTYPPIPTAKNTAAATNALEKLRVPATIYPVMIGARIAAICVQKFEIAPTVPTLSLGAIRDGTDHPTGAAAESPAIEMVIQNNAAVAVRACYAPTIASPIAVPPINTDCRTRTAFHPRCISASTSHPPTIKSVAVAISHGTLV